MGKYDSAWKDIVQAHFREFVTFYFPDVAAEIDFSHPVESLDKELNRLYPSGKSPGRIADVLARVCTHSDPEVLLYCHVEIQGRRDPEFGRRLFQVAYRILDHFGRLPVTLVILTDANPAWYPDAYEVTGVGQYLRVEFNVVKLVYYKKGSVELQESGNPFAFVTEALLEEAKAARSGSSVKKRGETQYALKKRLALRLFRKGFGSEYVESLTRFLDWLLQLPKELTFRLAEDIEKELGGKPMPYVTTWERYGEERGMEKGRLEEKQEVLIRQLTIKYGLEQDERSMIESCTAIDRLDAAIDAFPLAETKEDVLREIEQK